jgi:hypothetical protein
MPATESRHTPDELARLGEQIFDQRVRPTLQPADDGKFVAIDVASGDYEIDDDDYTAVMRLLSRIPTADIWLMRAGYRAAYKIGWAVDPRHRERPPRGHCLRVRRRFAGEPCSLCQEE